MCKIDEEGFISIGTVLTNIVLSPLPTATIIGGITKVFPLFGCKKVSPTMLPWQITGSTASTPTQPQILSLYPSVVSVFFVVDYVRRRLVLVLFSPLFFFFFFYPASITIRQETYATSFKLQTVPTHASAWRQVR